LSLGSFAATLTGRLVYQKTCVLRDCLEIAREHLKIEGVLSNIELLVELIFLDQALVEFHHRSLMRSIHHLDAHFAP